VEKTTDVLSVKDSRKFEVECRAGEAGELSVGSEFVSVKVGQRVRRDGAEEIWHSVGSTPRKMKMGTLRFASSFFTLIGMSRCKLQA